MFGFWRSRERELRTVWRVARRESAFLLVGTAHFFPWSFRGSLRSLLQDARLAVFEGPLDPEAMEQVRAAGRSGEAGNLLDSLGEGAVQGLSRTLFPGLRPGAAWTTFPLGGAPGDPVRDLVQGMEPWLAFFTIWTTFLERLGWTRSVDLEAHQAALELGRPVLFLESIAEQVQVLRGLSRERILRFLERWENWERMARDYERNYLQGRLTGTRWLSLEFPSRSEEVVSRRDHIFLERLGPHLEQGGAVVFVGAPHVQGMARLLTEAGWRVEPPLS